MNRSPSYVIKGDRTGSWTMKGATDDHKKNKKSYHQPGEAEAIAKAAAEENLKREAEKKKEAEADKKESVKKKDGK